MRGCISVRRVRIFPKRTIVCTDWGSLQGEVNERPCDKSAKLAHFSKDWRPVFPVCQGRNSGQFKVQGAKEMHGAGYAGLETTIYPAGSPYGGPVKLSILPISLDSVFKPSRRQAV